MYYGEIKNHDIANGIGVRVTLFVSGCTNRCKNCFQPQTWDFSFGKPFTEETEEEILKMLSPAYIHGLTVLGGEPFEPSNQRSLVPFLEKVREQYPQKSILSLLDVLVDGRYVDELRNLSLRFRGSSNQRLIDMKATLREGSIVLWDG